MQSFTRMTGIAAALPHPNIDTDVIMPKQFLKGVDRSGLSNGTFFDLRFDAAGTPRSDFVLNDPGWKSASFLVVGPNFGCGSSREHAVWGLLQYGIRALIGTSYAGIFFDNCVRNGLLAITLTAAEHFRVQQTVQTQSGKMITVDLPTQTIKLDSDGSLLSFAIDPLQKEMILNGLDPIDFTLKYSKDIKSFETCYFTKNAWHTL